MHQYDRPGIDSKVVTREQEAMHCASQSSEEEYKTRFSTPETATEDEDYRNVSPELERWPPDIERPGSARTDPGFPTTRSMSEDSLDTATLEAHSPGPTSSFAYSVPVSPVSASPETPLSEHSFPRDPNETPRKPRLLPVSLWAYLSEEIKAEDVEESQDAKAERVTNFIRVPIEVEKIIIFGFAICLDSFLYTFTILPLRWVMAAVQLSKNYTFHLTQKRRLAVSQKCDLVRGFIFLLACVILHRITDTSQMYHSVRGQETIKLYVLYNVLEIADRLCCSFGQDLFDSLCSRSALGRRKDGSQPRIRPAFLFGLSLLYILAHTLVLFYQLVTLNVAINSYSNALLTLLMSNQFVEIKGAVFKKFEKENLFQMSCADMVERFQLSLLLTIIALRNLIEVSGSTFSTLPASYISISIIPSFTVINRIFTPALIVLFSEVAVDWLKHAFITKFNHIRPEVYGRFIDVLCRDLIPTQDSRYPFVDNSPQVSRRIGFAAMPLGCLAVRVAFQIFDMMTDYTHIDECAPTSAARIGRGWLAAGGLLGPEWQARIVRWSLALLVGSVTWASMVVIKLLIGIRLREYATSRVPGMQAREIEDKLNARGRDPIGLNDSEKTAEKLINELVGDRSFDAGGKREVQLESSSSDRKVIKMENLGRFDIVKSRLY